MKEQRETDVYLLSFEAHRIDGKLELVGVTAQHSPGRCSFRFADTTDGFLTDAYWMEPNDGIAGDWFAINGSFVLPRDFDQAHPIFRCLVALGINPDQAKSMIEHAMQDVQLETRHE